MFYLCAEFYRGTGRLSRTWIVEASERPDAPDENGDIAYPYNGMGGAVVSEHEALDAAREAEAALQDEG